MPEKLRRQGKQVTAPSDQRTTLWSGKNMWKGENGIATFKSNLKFAPSLVYVSNENLVFLRKICCNAIWPQGVSLFLKRTGLKGEAKKWWLVRYGRYQIWQKIYWNFWLCCTACGILVFRPGIDPMFPALEVQRLYWTAREVLKLSRNQCPFANNIIYQFEKGKTTGQCWVNTYWEE